jgi:hypothetical protein
LVEMTEHSPHQAGRQQDDGNLEQEGSEIEHHIFRK